jgi:hypothetical protein
MALVVYVNNHCKQRLRFLVLRRRGSLWFGFGLLLAGTGKRDEAESASSEGDATKDGGAARAWTTDQEDPPADVMFTAQHGDGSRKGPLGGKPFEQPDEQPAVIGSFLRSHSFHHHGIASQLAVGSQPVQRKPHQRVEPVKELHPDEQDVEERVVSAHVRHFVKENEPQFLLTQVSGRGLGKKQAGSKYSEHGWAGQSRHRDKLYRSSDPHDEPGGVEDLEEKRIGELISPAG